MGSVRQFASIFAITALATQPLIAQTAPSKKDQGRSERICENITVTGSRLATKRFCGTRAEWEERKRLDRDAVEAAQRSPCVVQRTSSTGRASC